MVHGVLQPERWNWRWRRLVLLLVPELRHIVEPFAPAAWVMPLYGPRLWLAAGRPQTPPPTSPPTPPPTRLAAGRPQTPPPTSPPTPPPTRPPTP